MLFEPIFNEISVCFKKLFNANYERKKNKNSIPGP